MPAGIRLEMSSTDPTFALIVLTSSRASSLPHWIFGEHSFCVQHQSPVGASLLAMAADAAPQIQS